MIIDFISGLRNKPLFDNIFNPWEDSDLQNDIDNGGPKIRRNQLFNYLNVRKFQAKHLLLGEALGYQGGHFTGIAMTSERLLLGHLTDKGIYPNHVLQNLDPTRTSKRQIKEKGFTEPTATIVWRAIADLGLDPFSIVIWNAFPWHPYKEGNILSNRTPGEDEMQAGYSILVKLLHIFSFENIIAVGKKSDRMLEELGINHYSVRHPANGGASKFRDQFFHIVQKTNQKI